MKLDLDLLSFVVISVCFFILFIPLSLHNYSKKPQPYLPDRSITESQFFDVRWFYSGLEFARTSKTVFSKKPSVLIIPHHLIASYIMADLISASSKFKYEKIYLIGPNHFEHGTKKFLDGRLPESKEIIATDHSIGNPMLYLSYYFPNNKVIPIVLKHDATLADIADWTEYLSSDNASESLFIFSIDFSHYLPANTASEKDELTKVLISKSNLSHILSLNNDYVDSPSGLALSLSLSKKLQAKNSKLFYHSNSGLLLSDFVTGTTSYFGFAFFN
jgi:predicted class III extradiol MEMO1 family dioxygenase